MRLVAYVKELRVSRMHVRKNGAPLEQVYCFKFVGSQVAVDGLCEKDVVQRINEGYKARGVLKGI